MCMSVCDYVCVFHCLMSKAYVQWANDHRSICLLARLFSVAECLFIEIAHSSSATCVRANRLFYVLMWDTFHVFAHHYA